MFCLCASKHRHITATALPHTPIIPSTRNLHRLGATLTACSHSRQPGQWPVAPSICPAGLPWLVETVGGITKEAFHFHGQLHPSICPTCLPRLVETFGGITKEAFHFHSTTWGLSPSWEIVPCGLHSSPVGILVVGHMKGSGVIVGRVFLSSWRSSVGVDFAAQKGGGESVVYMYWITYLRWSLG